MPINKKIFWQFAPKSPEVYYVCSGITEGITITKCGKFC